MKMTRILLGVGALSLVGVGAAGVAWPLWADGMAHRKAEEWLESRFESAEIGEFALERESAILRNVVIHDEGIDATFPEIEIQFDATWDHITVSKAIVRGGSVQADLAALERMAEKNTASAISVTEESKVRIGEAMLEAESVAVGVITDAFEAQGVLAATKKGKSLDLTISDGSLSRGDHIVTFSSVSAQTSMSLQFPFTFTVSGASTWVTPEIPVSAVGGSITLADREMSSATFDLQGVGQDGSAAWAAKGQINRFSGEGRIELRTDGFEIGQLPGLYAALPLRDSEKAVVVADVVVSWAEGEVQGEGKFSVTGATVFHPMLSTTPVVDIAFSANTKVTLIPAARRLVIHHAQVQREAIVISMEGEFTHPEEPEGRSYEMHVRLDETPCQEVLDALPAEMVPGLRGFKLGGKFQADLDLLIVPSKPEVTMLKSSVGIDGCTIEKSPQKVQQLKGAFSHSVRRKDGIVETFVLAKGASDFTSFDNIAPAMAGAVLTTEDGGFWRHDGFLRSQFEASLRRNVELGRIRRGASTLTMQMVKNVLLSHERTLSRKIQELFLTWVIERQLSKERILEIYLNVVEFGPGIYGITRASQLYFGKDPGLLNGKEAAFLATLLPSPVRRYEQWCRGEPTPEYAAKVDRVFGFMHSRKRIDEETWELDRDTLLVFDNMQWPGEAACKAEARALLKATGVQWAESGLLSGRESTVIEEVADEEEVTDEDVESLLEGDM